MEDSNMPNDFGKYAIAITFLLATFYAAVYLTAGENSYALSFIVASALATISIGLFTKGCAFTVSWIPAILFGPLCMKYNAYIADGSYYSVAYLSDMRRDFWIIAVLVLFKTLHSEIDNLKPILDKIKTKIGITNFVFASIPVTLVLIACAYFTDVILMPIVFLLPLLTSIKSYRALPMLFATAVLYLAIAFNNTQLMVWMLALILITMILPPLYSSMKQKFN